MKFYLNYDNTNYKSGVYGAMPTAISDEVQIILPDGYKEVTLKDNSIGIEQPTGEITLPSEILTEHRGTTAIAYIMDCSQNTPKKVYLKVVKC